MSPDAPSDRRSLDPRVALRGAQLRPKKSLGQNFLVAAPIARAIAVACVKDEEVGHARVVEIGAGTGALTRWLAERARTLVAVEWDADLLPILAREVEGSPTTTVVHGDARALDFEPLLGAPEPESPRVLCGNLPYAITGLLLRRAVAYAGRLDRAVFMLQQEVAGRLLSAPGTKEWGALSVFVRAAFDARRVLRAPPGAFHPPPEVHSAVVELSPARPPRAPETERFASLVHGAFGARRKTLRNAWAKAAPGPAALEAAAREAGISLDVRGEVLDVEDFARMSAALDRLA